MKKKFEYKESRGLPGGPNEMFTYVTGVFSTDGYKANSPDVNNPFNIIPSGDITMEGVNFPVKGTDNLGNTKVMMPGNNYKFPGDMVFEVPMAQDGIEVPKRQGSRKNPDGTESTHLMATETLDGKNWFSFPTLFQDPDGTWIDMSNKPWQEAYEEAKRRGEVIDFGTDKEAAIKFGEGSWKLPKAQVGASALQEQKYGGSLLKAQDGGEEESQENFLRNWFENRQMPTPEGQKLLEKVRPEAIQRASVKVPYIMTEDLPNDVAGYYDTNTENIYLNKLYSPDQIKSTKEHEKVHYVQNGDRFYQVLDTPHQYLVDQNIKQPKEINTGNPEWDKNVRANYDDIVPQEEIHARIMTLRRLAGFQPNQQVTEEMLNNYFNSVKESGKSLDPDIEDLKAVTKGNSSIVNLLNDMVSNPVKKQDLQYAQEGGEETSWTDYINPMNWGVPNKDEAGDFKQAFRAARVDGDDEFMWHGNRYNTELASTPEKPKEEKLFYNPSVLKGLSEKQAARRQALLNAANVVAGAQGNDENLRRLLVMSAAMENTLGADPNAYGRDYTRGPMSIDDIAYQDLFAIREGARGYTTQQKKNAAWLNELGIDANNIEQVLRSDDPLAGMAAARLVYGRAPEALPSGDDPDALYNYYLKYYNKGGIDKYGGAEAHRKKFNDFYNQLYRQEGGEQNQFQIYKDYVYGVYDGTEMQKPAEKIYDKLNRVYYKEAKQSGTTVPNYILSKVMNQSG
jgi:hypothetical protein